MAVKGSYLIIAGIGGIFLWSSIKGKSVTAVVRTLIGGQDPSQAAQANQITPSSSGDVTGIPGLPVTADIPGGAVPVTSGTAAQNQAIARTLAAVSHPSWVTGQQWQDWNLTPHWPSESRQNSPCFSPALTVYSSFLH